MASAFPAGCVSDLAVQCCGCEGPYGECRASRRARLRSRRSSITRRRRSTFPRVAWFSASSEDGEGADCASMVSPGLAVVVMDVLDSRTKLLWGRPG